MLREVLTESGYLCGEACGDPRVTSFKGVPYAAPPVGDLRWRAPQPAQAWTGVRRADAYASVEMQVQPGNDPDDFFTREITPTGYECRMSEDCLYLNIWTPAAATDEELPVYLWIHGGGMQAGYAYEVELDGEQMARQGIIFITVGYRLNAFGFLAHPELTREVPGGCHGNYGLEDIVFALQWIKRNIRVFGGDPDRVTIGGQSGGAFAVITLCASPMVKGLISGAVAQSGGGLRAIGYGNKCAKLCTAEQYGQEFLDLLKVKSIEEARALPAETVYAAYHSRGMQFGRWSPTIDDVFLLEDPTDAMLNDHHLRIPYLFGSNSGEHPGTPAAPLMPDSVAAFEKQVRETMNPDSEELLKLCAVKTMDDVRHVMKCDAFNTRTISVRAYSRLQADQKRIGYFYLFNHDIPGEDQPGPYHGSEMWFTFHTLGHCWRPFKGKDYDLARQMSGYWANFVKHGDPNGKDAAGETLPAWHAYTSQDTFVMQFDDVPHKETKPIDPITEFRLSSVGFPAGR
jgi:para-nitrobenzyl esterase